MFGREFDRFFLLSGGRGNVGESELLGGEGLFKFVACVLPLSSAGEELVVAWILDTALGFAEMRDMAGTHLPSGSKYITGCPVGEEREAVCGTGTAVGGFMTNIGCAAVA